MGGDSRRSFQRTQNAHHWTWIRLSVGETGRQFGTEGQGTRSPHNIFYFTLAYSGFVGVGIFFWLEICIFRLLYRAFKVTRQTFGLAYFVYSMFGAFFGNFLESPAAISFYLLLGLCVGPMFLQMDIDKRAQLADPAAPIELAELV